MECCKKKIASIDQWVYALLIVVVLYLFFRLLTNLGWFSWLGTGMGEVSFGVAFLIGVAASLSTCLAVVGAVVISFAAKYQSSGKSLADTSCPHLLFHLGRLVSFALFGGLLGIVGSWITVSGQLMGWFTILIAIILVWLGLNILGLVPPISKYGLRLPGGALGHWHRLKESEHPLMPIVIGGFTFFLPCGFTQSMQLFAISSGSFWTGAMTMFLFALGTLPVLLGLGFATSRFSAMKGVLFKLIIGMIVIVFAYVTLLAGFAQAGIDLVWPGGGGGEQSIIQDNVQVVSMVSDLKGYNPNTFKVKAGVPVRWEINAKQLTGCTDEIVVPSLGIRQELDQGMNVIEFTPENPGTIGFSCWMGMVRGKFIIE